MLKLTHSPVSQAIVAAKHSQPSHRGGDSQPITSSGKLSRLVVMPTLISSRKVKTNKLIVIFR